MADPFEADEILTVQMPSGEHVFELETFRRWAVHRGKVQFETKLKMEPSCIEFSDVVFDGAADLYVTKITKKAFYFQVVAVFSKKGINSVSFDWEAIL